MGPGALKILLSGLVIKRTRDRFAREDDQIQYIHMYVNPTYMSESETPHTGEVQREKGNVGTEDILS